MKCPQCRSEVEGRFCGLCGATLVSRSCGACSATVPAGHRFCSECGASQAGAPGTEAPEEGVEGQAPVAAAGTASAAVGPGASPGSGPADPAAPDRRGWWILAAAVTAGILFLSVPYVWTGWAEDQGSARMPMGAPGNLPAPGPAPGVDLSSMTPREAADRLFNRVMTALGAGDQEEVASFLPMAIDAYRLVPNLDADGYFHLSLLEHARGDYLSALESARQVLATEQDHLLGLYAAGEASRELGDTEQARGHFSRFLEVYEAEVSRDLPEYREHASFLPSAREVAQDFMARPGS